MTASLPPSDPNDASAVFWAKVRHGPDCWEWLGPKDQKGYGKFGNFGAHRVAYELAVGPVPGGLVIDHLCRNPSCVNPAHLEPVTYRANMLRGKVKEPKQPRVALPCPACGLPLWRVTDSRPAGEMHRRRRRCANGHRATTYERVIEDNAAA